MSTSKPVMKFTQNNTELDVGRCSIDFGVLENLYVEAEIAFLSRTDAKLKLLPVSKLFNFFFLVNFSFVFRPRPSWILKNGGFDLPVSERCQYVAPCQIW